MRIVFEYIPVRFEEGQYILYHVQAVHDKFVHRKRVLVILE